LLGETPSQSSAPLADLRDGHTDPARLLCLAVGQGDRKRAWEPGRGEAVLGAGGHGDAVDHIHLIG